MTGHSLLAHQVLVLNQNYEPLMVCNARRALVMLLGERAEMVESSDRQVRSVRSLVGLPSVVRIMRYIRRPRQEVRLTKQNVLRRDRYTCQYCGATDPPMTTDHIIPRSQGGEDSWDNLVCACTVCNNAKGDRSLIQARMRLRRSPRKPHYMTFLQYSIRHPDNRWRPYLFLESA
jgi:5-methylcytosine-specific restriction endonuclease McrA